MTIAPSSDGNGGLTVSGAGSRVRIALIRRAWVGSSNGLAPASIS